MFYRDNTINLYFPRRQRQMEKAEEQSKQQHLSLPSKSCLNVQTSAFNVPRTSTPAKIHQDEQSEEKNENSNNGADAIVTMTDMSNIAEISDSFKISQSAIKDQLILSGIQNDVEHNDWNTEVCTKMNKQKQHSHQQTNSTIDNNSEGVHIDNNQSIVVVADVHWNNTSVDSPIPTSSRMNAKPRGIQFGRDTVYEVNKITRETDIDDINPKIMIKGGKWRRTIFELRKNKITKCEFNYLSNNLKIYKEFLNSF